MIALLKRLSLRHLLHAPLRSGLVVLGIALGVAVVVASRATSDGMVGSFDELVQRVAGRADLMVVGNESGIPSALTADVAAVEGVAHAAAALEVTTNIASDGHPLLILGVDFLGDTHFLPFRGAGGDTQLVDDPLSFVNDPRALLVTRSLAERRGLGVDSELPVLSASGTTNLVVRGILEDSGPAASFGGQVAVMFLDAAQVTFARGSLVDRIDVAVAQGADPTRVTERILQTLDGAARVEKPAQVGERLRSLAAPLADGLRMSGVVALIVGIFIIYNAIGVSVAQRRREVGVLRALGVIRRNVVLHFCLEALVLAIFGVVLGSLLARELVQFTHLQTQKAIASMFGQTASPPHITWEHLTRGAIAGFAISWVAAYLPARRGARLDPVAALRATSASISSRGMRHGLLAVGGFVLMASAWVIARRGTLTAGYVATGVNLAGAGMVVPLIVISLRRLLRGPSHLAFGVSGRLGLDYVERSLSRSTINVLALMVAVALSVAIAGWLNSFERSVRDWFEQVSAADFTVTAGSPVADRRRMRLAPETVDKLAGVPGLESAQPIRMMEQRVGDDSFRLMASDTRTYLVQAAKRGKPWKVLEGREPILPDELRTAPNIVLGENAAYRLGLHAGDRLTLTTPTGPVSLLVRAVVVDYSSELGTGFIDRALFLERWQDSAIDVINLYLEDGADPERVADEVRRRLGGGKALFVTGTSELREEFVGLVNESFSYTRSLELIVLIIALLGVIGTMVAAVLDRTREIGMLRAVGATRRQVVSAMVIEAAFLGLCAGVAGVLAGTLQCALFLRTLVAHTTGWYLPFVFPTEGALRISLLVVATAAAAGLVPGLRAARLEVKEALVNE